MGPESGVAMISLLGMACVVWTAYELSRIVRGTPRAAACPRSRPNGVSAPRRRFRAWDDHGRPIEVEDLGHR